MSHEAGAYLGGVRCLVTLRDRCVVDRNTGCWHLRMPRTGRALPQGRRHMLHVHGCGKITATRAAWLVAHGQAHLAAMSADVAHGLGIAKSRAIAIRAGMAWA